MPRTDRTALSARELTYWVICASTGVALNFLLNVDYFDIRQPSFKFLAVLLTMAAGAAVLWILLWAFAVPGFLRGPTAMWGVVV